MFYRASFALDVPLSLPLSPVHLLFSVVSGEMVSWTSAQSSFLLCDISGGQVWACRMQPQAPSLGRALFLSSDSALESASSVLGRGCNLTHRLFALESQRGRVEADSVAVRNRRAGREASPTSEGVSAAWLVDAGRPSLAFGQHASSHLSSPR